MKTSRGYNSLWYLACCRISGFKHFLDTRGLHGRGVDPSQGLYLHRAAAQYRKTQTCNHTSSEIRNHDPYVRAVKTYISGHCDRLLLKHSRNTSHKYSLVIPASNFPRQNDRIITQNKPRPFPSASLPIHHYSIKQHMNCNTQQIPITTFNW